jgi:hypothetical protein
MICYKDMTFCPIDYWDDCKHRGACLKPLTDDVTAAADRWWNQGRSVKRNDAPISVFAERPNCYEQEQPKIPAS